MVGVNKPSLHSYTQKVILYEGNTSRNLVNITSRLAIEERQGWSGAPIGEPRGSDTALLVIDTKTSELKHWKGLGPDVLGQFGIYKVWRVNRRRLQDRAIELIVNGVRPNWRLPTPERF